MREGQVLPFRPYFEEESVLDFGGVFFEVLEHPNNSVLLELEGGNDSSSDLPVCVGYRMLLDVNSDAFRE